VSVHTQYYLMFFLGLGSGIVLTVLFLYLPMRAHARTTANNRRETARILWGIRGRASAAVSYALGDAQGAYQQARAAYIPIYPGNSGRHDEPSDAWVAWISDGGVDYWARPFMPKLRTQALIVLVALCWHMGRTPLYWQVVADRVWPWTAPMRQRLAVGRQWALALYGWWMQTTAPVLVTAAIRPKRYYRLPFPQ